ncbi:MAG: TPM domain-containing protein [Rubrivivax sp.]
MGRLTRILKHRWYDETDALRALDEATLTRLQKQVQSSEKLHRGEIRLCIEAGLPLSYLWRDATARERAVAMFGKLRVWDTEHNSGVLIYLLLAEHAIEIVADRGLNQHVSPEQWRGLTQGMSAAFKDGRFEEGVVAAIAAVDGLLNRHFPLTSGTSNPNELPDRPFLR